MKRAIFFIAAAFASLAGCGRQPVVVPTRNLDRPTDMTFVCMQSFGGAAGQPPVVSAAPMWLCHPPGQPNPEVAEDSQRVLGTFGLLTNSGRGEVAGIDLDRSRLVDLDEANPGFGMLPVGRLPELIDATQDGCRAATVNRGSCDVSFIDVSQVLASKLRDGTPPPELVGRPVAPRVGIKLPSGKPLRARPGELQFLPQPTSLLGSQSRMCRAEGARVPVADQLPENDATVPWRAVMTFPACDLVAVVKFPSGQIESAAHVRATGIEILPPGVDPVCPAECDGEALPGADGGVDDAPVDAGADAGAPAPGTSVTSNGLRIGPLALVPDGSRVYVGGANAPFVAGIPISFVAPTETTGQGTAAFLPPLGGGFVRLHERALGTTRLRLSYEPYALDDPTMKGTAVLGRWVGRRGGQYLFAVALDGSVRVIDVAGRNTGAEVECEANLDPNLAYQQQGVDAVRTIRCVPVPDDPVQANLQRRPQAKGPGLRLPPRGADADAPRTPVADVAFVDMFANDTTDNRADGAFALVLSLAGDAVYVNLDPTPRSSEDPRYYPLLPFSLRDQNVGIAGSRDGKGRPRVSGSPILSLSDTDLPFALQTPLRQLQPVRLEGVPTSDPALNPLATPQEPVKTFALFPRPSIATPVSGAAAWKVTWEAALAAGRATGVLRPTEDGRWLLEDPGADFCSLDVRAGDIVQLGSCEVDENCGDPKTFTCLKANASSDGLCITRTAATRVDPASCAAYLDSRRRYLVTRAKHGQLELSLLLDELPRPSIRPCDPAREPGHSASCTPLGAPTGYQCLAVTPGEGPRCVRPCGPAAGGAVCRPGFTCQALADGKSYCVEAPPPPFGCFPEEIVYRVHAGRSFLVGSTYAPRVHEVIEDPATQECRVNPTRPATEVTRIPMAAPECPSVPTVPSVANGLDNAPSAEVLANASPVSFGVGRNPCLFLSQSNADDPATFSEGHVKALFENAEVRFILTNLETYVGDSLETQFSVVGGLIPTAPSTAVPVSVPTRLVVGPRKLTNVGDDDPTAARFPYLYLVDAGRLSASGNRGQVLRFNPRGAYYDTNRSTVPFQIQ